MPLADTTAYLCRPAHLRRTICIAFTVGIVLSTINQLGVITAGHANTATWLRCGLNFVVPFIVSNLGLLSGRPRPPAPRGTAAGPADRDFPEHEDA